MSAQFPEIEPYDRGMLATADGQHIYWETCGNPDGIPALYVHGGPGSGCSPGQRRFFDPSRYRAVLFDQRGSGRSRPRADEPNCDLRTNTTQHLIADIEALRRHLDIDRWTLLGMSWGTTLGLAYAHAHRERVRALILALVTTTSRAEVEWTTEGVGSIFPEQWERFANAVPESLREMRLVDAYARLVRDTDPAVHEAAAREWCRWEDAHVSLAPGHQPNPRYENPEFRLRFARLVTHYWSNSAFLEENQLIREASALNGIPGVLIHGRQDVSSPLGTAWELSKRWQSSRLEVLEDGGHGDGPSFIPTVMSAMAEMSEIRG